MPANAISQETVRAALGTLLTTTLTGVGKPAQVVFDHFVSDFSGDDSTVSAPSPVVMLTSGGVARQIRGLGALTYRSFMRVWVWFFVADAKADDSWTDEDVDTTLDDLEKELADSLSDNQATANWNYVRYENLETPGEEPQPVLVGGESYIRWRVPVILEVHDA